jgi:hypothetical protein
MIYQEKRKVKYFDVSLSNKRNILLSHPISAFLVHSEFDLLVLHSDQTNEIVSMNSQVSFRFQTSNTDVPRLVKELQEESETL